MIEDKRVGDRPARAVWLYLSDIREKSERGVEAQAKIQNLLQDIRLYLQILIGVLGIFFILWLLSVLKT